MENIFVEFLPPWVETGIQPAFYDKESGTALQQTARMYARVNMLIRMFNKLSKNTKTIVDEYVEKFNILYDYVHDYFDNLDVQEEINHKLDEMVEDGTLENILLNYTNITKVYDTFSDLVADENLTDGMIVQCLGYSDVNDGFGGVYRLTTEETPIQINNSMYAILINNYQDNYTDNIKITKTRYYNTTCYITEIPMTDLEGRQIDLHVGKATDGINQTPLKYAQDNNTTLTTNGAMTYRMSDNIQYYPFIIGDGEVLNDDDLTQDANTYDCYEYICIDSERNVTGLSVKNTSLATLQNGGYTQVISTYYRLVNNSQIVDLTDLPTSIKNVATNLNPRQVFGVKNDKTIILLTSNGRTEDDLGLTSEQTAQIMLGLGCVNVWNLGGGGDVNLTYKGTKLNNNIDDGLTSDRFVRFTLNVKNPIINKNIADATAQAGVVKQDIMSYLIPLIPFTRLNDYADANDIYGKTWVIYGNHLSNTPHDHGHLINLPNTYTQENRNLYNKQIFIPYNQNSFYIRQMINGDWGDWNKIENMTLRLVAPEYTITSNATYEKISFSSTTRMCGDNNLTRNNDQTISFINNDGNVLKMLVQGRVLAHTAGLKRVRVTKNDTEIYSFMVSCPDTTNHVGFSFEVPLQVSASTDKFAILVYGVTGDKFDQFYNIVKS